MIGALLRIPEELRYRATKEYGRFLGEGSMMIDVDAIDWWQLRQDAKAKMTPDELAYEDEWWKAACAITGAPLDPQPKNQSASVDLLDS